MPDAQPLWLTEVHQFSSPSLAIAFCSAADALGELAFIERRAVGVHVVDLGDGRDVDGVVELARSRREVGTRTARGRRQDLR